MISEVRTDIMAARVELLNRTRIAVAAAGDAIEYLTVISIDKQ
jgi:hypothetical protein